MSAYSGAFCVMLLAACGGGSEIPATKIFTAPTWQVGEKLWYQLRERNDILGSCTFSVEATAEATRVVLASLCVSPDARYRDERRAEVDAVTLAPVSSERTIADEEQDKRSVWSAEYGTQTVTFSAVVNGKQNETTRDLPEPTDASPDPGHYDDVSLFWLIRGAALEDGYESTFINANGSSARTFPVGVKVAGSEVVTVPAGEFDTWEVEVKSGGVTQVLWVEKAGARRVVRARIEREFYELVATE